MDDLFAKKYETRAVFELDKDRLLSLDESFDAAYMDANVFRQLKIFSTHPSLFSRSRRRRRQAVRDADQLFAAMKETGKTHDYPSLPDPYKPPQSEKRLSKTPGLQITYGGKVKA